MPAPTPDEFWSLLVSSRLFKPDAAAQLRAEHAALPAADGSVKAIAGWLSGRGAITRWQAKRLANGDAGPFVLGDYRLLERHDRDGDGLLFTARHDPSGRIVSLMLLNARRCREVDVWTEIVRRTNAAHRATDPMLSRTWSLEQQGGSRFIVCEPVTGVTLADEVERLGPLPPHEAGAVAWQVARAVADLHGLGEVHGSVSLDVLRREAAPGGGPERQGRLRLLQFPLASDPHRPPSRPLVANDAELARLGRTSAFVPPELLVPGVEWSPRSDVYAIGAVLSALLTGAAPCWNGDPRATLQRASFQGPAALPPTIPRGLAAVVGRMMDRDPSQRYASAGEAADALEACLGLHAPPVGASRAVATEPPPVTPPIVVDEPLVSDMPRVVVEPMTRRASRPATRRARRWGLIGGGVATAILAGAVALVVGRLDGRKPAAPVTKSRQDSGRGRDGSPADQAAVAVAAESPPTEATPESDEAATPAPRQIVVDDPALPWASPTSGPPPSLAYLPPGSQLVLLARLAEISADDEGRLFLQALGPAAEDTLAGLVKLCGGDIGDIELVQAGWQTGGPDEVVGGFAARFVKGRTAPADEASRQRAWGDTTVVAIDGETVHRASQFSFWVPTTEQGRVLVIAPNVMVAKDVALDPAGVAKTAQEPLVAAIIRESRAADASETTELAAALPRDLEALVGMLDADRHVTVFGSPHYLLNSGRPLLAGPLARLVEPMDRLFGESLQAAALSLHFGDNAYVEMDAVAALDVPARKRVPGIAARVEGLSAEVERFCASLDPDPYGRVLVLRLPAMLRALVAQVRAGAEGQGVVLNAYLPRHAAHNLALAAELALAQRPAAAVSNGVATPSAAEPKDALGKLGRTMTLAFDRDNLERSIQMVSDETGVPMEILGADLQLEGITKNQSFGLDEHDKTADEILRVILAKSNPDGKLVYIVTVKDGEEWVLITTRAAVEKRGETLPPGFSPKP